MANTPTTIRLSPDLIADLDAEAASLDRSRSWVILRRLFNGNSKDVDVRGATDESSGPVGRSGNGTAVPVLRKTKGAKERLHPVLAVRRELVVRGDGIAGLPESRPSRSASEKCPHGKLNAAYCRLTGGGC